MTRAVRHPAYALVTTLSDFDDRLAAMASSLPATSLSSTVSPLSAGA
jgi:hypothetical protein